MAFTPAVLGAIAVVGTVASAAGALIQANAASEASRYQAMVADRQRQINLLNATRALDRSRQEVITADQQTRALLGEQIATQSASGLKLGGRSQILTRKAARELGRMDALNVAQAGEIEAYNYRVAATDAGNEAKFLRQQSGNQLLAGFMGATGTLIGGLPNFKFPSSGLSASGSAIGSVGALGNLGTRKVRFV